MRGAGLGHLGGTLSVAKVACHISDRIPILRASELLDQRQEAVKRLHGGSALSETQFRVLFWPLLLAFAESVQTLPKGEPGQRLILDLRLQRAERVLRRRRGVILPPGADSEQVARAEDLWTYAVFSIALLRQLAREMDFWKITLWSAHDQPLGCWAPHKAAKGLAWVKEAQFYRLERATLSRGDWTPLMVGALMPQAALNWLWREPEVFDVWQKALSRPDLPEWIQPLFLD